MLPFRTLRKTINLCTVFKRRETENGVTRAALRLHCKIEGQVLQSYIVIVHDSQRATIFHDADDYTARFADPKAETHIRHMPQLRPAP